jgi:hypothetical protein
MLNMTAGAMHNQHITLTGSVPSPFGVGSTALVSDMGKSIPSVDASRNTDNGSNFNPNDDLQQLFSSSSTIASLTAPIQRRRSTHASIVAAAESSSAAASAPFSSPFANVLPRGLVSSFGALYQSIVGSKMSDDSQRQQQLQKKRSDPSFASSRPLNAVICLQLPVLQDVLHAFMYLMGARVQIVRDVRGVIQSVVGGGSFSSLS